MKKSVYKSAMSRVKTSDDFKEATYQKMMSDIEKTTQTTNINHKERFKMEKANKKKLTGWTVGIAACAVLSFSILTMNQNAPTGTPQPTAGIVQAPTSGKVAVNIDGVISEVSADGKSFKVGDLWVKVTADTKLGIDGPTAAEPSEELLQKEFKVGNIVSGFTSGDVSTGEVTADAIYNNIAPQNDEAANPPAKGKAAVNIDGVISEVSADGNSFKVGDLWVTVTPDTELGIGGPTAAAPSEELLQKEFKVGNFVSGFTTEDVSSGKVTATNIYNNMAPAQ
ncbi:DUF5666 domain-containing protein [Paenibacillus sinopodophylli]|uniref:DUF5666 domain-containing protein n=1 Tax=Paenibacillus sinopodophylli TaxID=1837342 RepID=UPI00110CD6F6|nr:DUF5666 domain-containing protein [Paenibacillus sinopodophylli]